MPGKRDCRWWESTVCGETSFFAECRDTYGSPLAGIYAEVAQALSTYLDEAYCPWCGGCIVWCDENEVPDERAEDEEYRRDVALGTGGYR